MVLKHWILPNNQFKTHLFFSIFGWGSWSEGWTKLQSSLEKPTDKCQRTHIIQNSFHDAFHYFFNPSLTQKFLIIVVEVSLKQIPHWKSPVTSSWHEIIVPLPERWTGSKINTLASLSYYCLAFFLSTNHSYFLARREVSMFLINILFLIRDVSCNIPIFGKIMDSPLSLALLHDGGGGNQDSS